MLPWVEKYRPKKASNIIGNAAVLEELRKFVQQKKKRLAILYGKTGTGKTSLVHVLASELESELVEINASDHRNKEEIEARIGHAAVQQSLFSKAKIILIDDVECISGMKDRGAVTTLLEIEKKTKWPLIITITDPTDERIKPLLKVAQLLEVKTPSAADVVHFLKNICEQESLSYDQQNLESLAYRSGGDVRVALTDLQFLSYDGKVHAADDLYTRDQEKSIEEVLTLIFRMHDAKTVLQYSQNADVDLDELKEWVDENLPYAYPLSSLQDAYHALSRADVFSGRIRRWQHWRFLVYISSLLTAGVAVAKKDTKTGLVSFKRSQRGLKIWIGRKKHIKRTELAEGNAEALHISKKKAYKEVAPYLEVIQNHESR